MKTDKVKSELERNNKAVMITHLVTDTVLIIFCLLQFLTGIRTTPLFVVDLILGFGPVIAEYICWKKNHEHRVIKHLMALGFAVFFSYTMFTSTNNMAFMFVVPAILMYTVYNDMKGSLAISVGVIIISLIMCIVGAQTGTMGYDGMDDAIIIVTCSILFSIFITYSSKVSSANSRDKIEHAKTAQENSEKLLQDLTHISDKLQEGIREIYAELEKFSSASVEVKESMSKLSEGASEASDAVQKQTNQTQAIQEKVDMVTTITEDISESMKHTLQVLDEGHKEIELLVGQIDHTVQNGEVVTEKLKNLDSYVEEMNSVVNLISGIANQTSMLALNASIEAARAGEAGRGFAVVASQVTGMASQTKDATLHITGLITNVSMAISDVVTVIQQMLDGIEEEKRISVNTVDSFNSIQENTNTIRENVTELVQSATELKDANQLIVDSIQTLSSISEEVSSRANDTFDAEEANTSIVQNIDKQMQELMQLLENK